MLVNFKQQTTKKMIFLKNKNKSTEKFVFFCFVFLPFWRYKITKKQKSQKLLLSGLIIPKRLNK